MEHLEQTWLNLALSLRLLWLKQLYWWKWQSIQQLNYKKADNELPMKLRRISAYGLNYYKLKYLTNQISQGLNYDLWPVIKGDALNENANLLQCLEVLNNLENLSFIHNTFVQCLLNRDLIKQWHNELEYGLFLQNTIKCIGSIQDKNWMLLDTQKISIQNNTLLADYHIYFNANNGLEAVRWGDINKVQRVIKKDKEDKENENTNLKYKNIR